MVKKYYRRHYKKNKRVRARIVRAMAAATPGGRGRIKNRPAYRQRVLGRWKRKGKRKRQ